MMPGMNMTNSLAKTTASSPGSQTMQMSPEPTTDLATTLVWGRTRSLTDSSKENSYLAEASLRFAGTSYLWTRVENAGRTNELFLTPGASPPANFVEQPIGHVAAYTVGYDHDLPLGPRLVAAPGAQFTVYRTPTALRSVYGSTPTAEQWFIRFRLR
jgi:hypothetical protein